MDPSTTTTTTTPPPPPTSPPPPPPPPKPLQSAQEYYSTFNNDDKGLHLGRKFHNIDDVINFKHYMRLLQDVHTRNFVLDFGDEDAWCAVNLREEDFGVLLGKPKPRRFGTRWINIWAPEEQKASIKTIMSHYSISERLQGMMCTEPVLCPSKPAVPAPVPPPVHTTLNGVHSRNSHQPHKDDLEGAYSLNSFAQPETMASFKNLTFAQITDQIWHFCTVDYGQRYTCIGYNSLYSVPNLFIENGKGLPDGKRLWSWLILCDDGTVISIQENPHPKPQGPLQEDEIKSVLDVVRRNVRLIFAGVSKQHSASSESESLVTIRVRQLADVGPDQARIKQEDGPSLLFYYIFDDWVSSYGLIAKREHAYGVYLDKLRGQMLVHPNVDLVNELHWLGRRLAVLKRLYQSYELIMRRILQRQYLFRDEPPSNRGKSLIGKTFEEMDFVDSSKRTMQSNLSVASNCDALVGVPLSSAAVGRFERLADRIKLYCLSEIESCLTEKESLTFLNFNFIALKDSQAVEKLTRITVLLGKGTILFLPVSLMTAYFSTQIDDLQGVYTKSDYWVSFAVIMFLSAAVLVIFGYASDTVEGRTIYRSLVRTFFRSSRDRISHRRKG